MFDLDPETRTLMYYGLMAFSVLFLVFVFGSRYLTRHEEHDHEEEEEDDE